MTRYHPVCGLRTAALERTGATGAGLSLIVDSAVLAAQLLPLEGLSCRADHAVGLGLIAEGGSIKEVAIAMGVDAARGRHMSHDPEFFATAGLLSVGVSCVRYHVQSGRLLQRLRGRLRHRQQAAIVTRVHGDGVSQDQSMFRIDGGLHVVSGGVRPRHRYKANLWFLMVAQLLHGSLHRGRIDSGLLFFIGLFAAVQIAAQRVPLRYAVAARYGAELRSIDGDPLALDQSTGAREPHQLLPRIGYRLDMHPPELGGGLVIGI